MNTTRVPMSDVRAAANAAGNHWFSPDSMRFFRTRLPLFGERDSTGRVWFVTSEAPRAGARRYSVRCFIPNTCNITTHGEFHSHRSRAAAINAMQAAINNPDK